MSFPRAAVSVSIFACLLSTVLSAQTPTAVVNGTVVDSSGASVPDARVVAVNQDTNVASQKNTAPDGRSRSSIFCPAITW